MPELVLHKIGIQYEVEYAMVKYAAGHEAERCGVLRFDMVQRFNGLPNQHPDPQDNFQLPDGDYTGCTVFHSHWRDTHPGELTPADIAASRLTGLPYLLYHAGFKTWDYWSPQHWHPWPLKAPSSPTPEDLTGWPFVYGRSDCWTVCRAALYVMTGVLVADPIRGQEVGETVEAAWALIERSAPGMGFTEADSIQVGDILTYRTGAGGANHCAIVLDDRRMLHHPGEGRISCIEGLSLRNLHKIWRYTGKA